MNDRRPTAGRRAKGILWLTGLLLAAMAVAVAERFGPSRLEPRHEGRRLGAWLRGHPREYTPAVQAVGTNALPYLLSELRVTDPFWLRWGEAQFARLEMGPPWEPARVRRYHARLALQILDTNAAPALLDAVFARPMRLRDGDPGYEAAFALTWMASPAAQELVASRIDGAMNDADAKTRRTACLALAAGNLRHVPAARIVAMTRDAEPAVRAAALRAVAIAGAGGEGILDAVAERLTDDHAVVRRLSAEALASWRTNAAPALPALCAAWTNEPARPRGAAGLDDWLSPPSPPDRMREVISTAIRAVASGVPPIPRGDDDDARPAVD
ncbi:MAG: hypothetical protein FJ221_05710 [Lentisphaerae bacterium]|nr:hypothetical protein [Lentisphaerota bacterium]